MRRAVPVVFHLMNGVMKRLLDRHRRMPATVEEARVWRQQGAWSIVIDAAPTPGRFNGHLLLVTDNWVCDPALDQAARPEENLDVEPLRIPRPEGFPDRKRTLELEHPTSGAWLDYRVQRRPSSDWTRTPDWRGTTPDDPLVREVVGLVRQTTS